MRAADHTNEHAERREDRIYGNQNNIENLSRSVKLAVCNAFCFFREDHKTKSNDNADNGFNRIIKIHNKSSPLKIIIDFADL